MNRGKTVMNKACSVFTGIGLGAGLMYLLDPDRGRRRRALMRDKTLSAWRRTGRAIRGTACDLGNRARGIVAEANAAFRRREGTDYPDSSTTGPRTDEASIPY